jgi:VWFA-related protein
MTTLHASARLVLLDVVVTEKGAAVHGLDRQRFHVFEDGHEQPVAFFEEHSSAEPHPASSRPAMIPTTLPPHTFTNLPQTGDATAVNVLLLDGLNTPLSRQMNVRHQILEYASTIRGHRWRCSRFLRGCTCCRASPQVRRRLQQR